MARAHFYRLSPDPPFRWRAIAVPAFGPSLLFSVGEGAILPVIALSARDQGASVALAALVVSFVGLGSLVSNIPAALCIARYGERRAMLGATAAGIVALAVCVLARHVGLFAVGIFLLGMATSVLLLARQTWLIEAVPAALRARAMSSLGGMRRIGVFVGPLIGAGAIHLVGLRGAYLVAIVALVACGALVWRIPDFDSTGRDGGAGGGAPGMPALLRRHRRTYGTLGVGVLLVKGIRTCRQIVIPLWAAHLGIQPATISVIYAAVALIDMLMFYPSGIVMDRYGRRWAAVPCLAILGTALIAITATTGLGGFLAAAMALGFGNGLGSGLVMTVGADVSPVRGRVAFLGLWRLFADIGGSLTPMLLSAIAGAASLAAGIIVTGSLGFVAAAIFARWLPRPVRRSADLARHHRAS